MMVRLITALLLNALLLLAAPAEATLQALEQAIETTTRAVSLPEGGGTLIVKRCPGCDSLLLKITEQTASYVNDEQVQYKDLQRLASRSIGSLVVFYEPESRQITRLVLTVRQTQ